MSLIDDICKDREAGTPGPWVVEEDIIANQVQGFPLILADTYMVVGTEGMYGDIDTDYANAKRIARVPDMEAALLAAEELADAIKGCYMDFSSDHDATRYWDALDAYRRATGDSQ